MKRSALTGRQVARYVLLPGIVPQLHELLATGFGFIAVCLAQVYAAVRLLPRNHPYLLPANAGRFGIRQVVMEASSRVTYKRDHIDQIFVFYLLLGGLVILAMQIGLLLFGIFGHAAHAAFNFTYAAPQNFDGFVGTPDNTGATANGNAASSEDVAFVLLDRVFGIPNFFTTVGGQSTCVALDQPCFSDFNPNSNAEGNFPWPFHDALHGMLSFYSIGLLVIGVLIFCYYIFAVAAETAQTGTPFGRRFNQVWAPIRMVVALGLLIPLPIASGAGGGATISGLNGAQYILLYAAKWGSGFATNGWNLFTGQVVGSTLAGDQASLIGVPGRPDVKKLLEFMLVAETCRAAYEEIGEKQVVRAYVVRNTSDPTPREEIDNNYTYDQALTFYHNQDIRIVFGSCVADPTGGEGGSGENTVDCDTTTGNEVYSKELGFVAPLCGEVDIPVSGAVSTTYNPGAYAIEKGYFELVRDTWLGDEGGDTGDVTTETGYNSANGDVCDETSPGTYKTWLRHWGYCFIEKYAKPNSDDNGVEPPDEGDLENLMDGGATAGTEPTDGYNFAVQQIINGGVTAERGADEWAFSLQNLGWAGAGIWYNKIAQMNGALITAAKNIPRVKHYPRAMEETADQRLKNDANVKPREVYDPKDSNGAIQVKGAESPAEVAASFAATMSYAYHIWDKMYPQASGNAIVDMISSFFTDNGLYNLRKNCTGSTDATCVSNVNVTPLALLAGLGDSLISGAVVTMGLSGASTVLAALGGAGETLLNSLGSMLTSIGVMLLFTGFILYYVVPFLPFLYFFFAVGSWIKGIFEAMVGVPLWALAHIRIDGEGLAGQAAIGGYFMLLEIFLRPILIVFGMLASILLFAAQVFVLNDIWDMVTSNLTGFDYSNKVTAGVGSPQWARGWIDKLAFTILYAFVVYMIGTSSFKLILLLPKGIMRWMGSNVGAFSDQEEDPAQGLVGRISGAGSIVANNAGGFSQSAGKAGRGLRGAFTGKSTGPE